MKEQCIFITKEAIHSSSFYRNSVILTLKNGKLIGYGNNESSQLGEGHTKFLDKPTELKFHPRFEFMIENRGPLHQGNGFNPNWTQP